MVKETGKVIGCNNGLATILIDSKPACNTCQLCKKGKSDMIMEVATGLTVSPGQLVTLEISGRNLLMVSFILYIVPVIDLVIGIVFGMFIAGQLSYEKFQDEFGLITGFIFFSTSFFLARRLDKKLKTKSMVNIKLISEAEKQT